MKARRTEGHRSSRELRPRMEQPSVRSSRAWSDPADRPTVRSGAASGRNRLRPVRGRFQGERKEEEENGRRQGRTRCRRAWKCDLSTHLAPRQCFSTS